MLLRDGLHREHSFKAGVLRRKDEYEVGDYNIRIICLSRSV